MKSLNRVCCLVAFAAMAACSAPVDGSDASDVATGTDASDVSASPDVMATDAVDAITPDVVLTDVPARDAQSFSCGTMTCAPNQLCVSHSGGALIAPSCVDVPAACGGVPTCECVCTVGAMFTCSTTDNQTFTCACTTCP